MIKITSTLALILVFISQVFGQVTPSFDIYSYSSRFGPKSSSYHSSNGFKFAELLTHGSIYSNDQNKWDVSKIDYFLNKNFPNSSSSGSVVIDWETGVFKDLRDYPTTDSRFKYAENQFITLVEHIKSKRPNVKVAIYGMPYRVWGDWQVNNYNPAGKYDKLLSKTDFLTPSVYTIYADEEVGHARNLEYLKDNLNIALATGKKLNKPVVAFMWHKVHDYNKSYGREIIQKDVFVKYLQYIANFSYEGYKVRGIVWWDESNTNYRLGDLSGINNHLTGKLTGSTNAEKYDNLMLDYSKAMVQMLQSGSYTSEPTPSPAPGESTQQVTGFTVFDASTKKAIQTLSNGATLDLASLPTKNLNIRANTNTSVGSVKFNLSGAQSKSATESLAPYDLMGDVSSWNPVAGDYTIKATPYSSSGGSGTAGTSLSVSFKVVNQSSSSSNSSFTLVNADTKKDIQAITAGGTIDLSTLPTRNLNIRFSTNTSVGSVKFNLSGAQSKSATESLAPYDLMGDVSSWNPVAGDYTIKATPYSSSGGSGTAGTSQSVSFTVVDGSSSTGTVNSGTENQVISFTLVNADTDKDIAELASGATLNLAALPTKNLNIRANTGTGASSVVFSVSGAQSRSYTESGRPFAVFGGSGDNYSNWTPALGSYTLKATPYSAKKGSGSAGASLTINFEVVSQSGLTAISTSKLTSTSFTGEDGLVAYPNPATSYVNVESSDIAAGTATIKLFDLNGREVLVQKESVGSAGLKTVLDVSNVREGLYTLVVEAAKGRITRRIVVQ